VDLGKWLNEEYRIGGSVNDASSPDDEEEGSAA
jgi:endogenous inhibitor of DNA gyrase (YacG/DUF329 family)